MSIDNENFDDADDRPLHSPARVLGMRIVVSLAIAGLVLPGILITWSTQARTAAYACEITVAYYAPGASAAHARFQVMDPRLVGWNCYAEGFSSDETFVAHLGIIPGAPRLVPVSGS